MIKNGDAVQQTKTYTYKSGTSGTSSQIATYTVASGAHSVTYTYQYDDNGNIISISDGSSLLTYAYDSANQIIRENNTQDDFTKVWTYDNAGNILTATEYDYSTGALGAQRDQVQYGYGDDNWGDLLTAFDGKQITYDEIGNPLTKGSTTYTWEHGRQLKSLSDGGETWTYTYNSDGLRTGRTNGQRTYTYVYSGSQLTQMTVDGYTLEFGYDAKGTPLTLRFNDTLYYYITNIQGDVIGIQSVSGEKVLIYEYSAWGQVLYTNSADIPLSLNPLRYRGYVYDVETDLYYLQSRYYDPQMGRFLNADGLTSTGQGLTGNNMFAYCGNNPINRTDPMGGSWIVAAVVGVIVACAVTFTGCSSKPTSNVGSAQPYNYVPGSNDPRSPNCYAYAVGSPVNEQPGKVSGRIPKFWNDVYDVGKSVEADLLASGYTVRQISGPNAKIYANEFKIALRVGTQPYAFNRDTGELYYDYHFMRQTDTGQWAEKHGYGGASILWDKGTTPDTIPWTLGGVPYYDSEIIYYAVGR